MIKEYIEQQARMMQAMGHGLLETFVLRNGAEYQPKAHSFKMGEMKQCYKNAAEFMLRTPATEGFLYCEGYAVRESLGILMQHAWVVDLYGCAYDLTWEDAQECHYFGVSFTKPNLVKELNKTKVYGLLDTGLGYNMRLLQRIDPKLMSHWKTAVARETEKFKRLSAKLERSVDSDT